MHRTWTLAGLLVAASVCLVVANCGSGPTGFGDDGSADGTIDGGSSDASTNDVIFVPSDAQPVEATTPKPVSSLTLEQVWFITGEPISGSKDMLIDFRDASAPVVTCGPPVSVSTGNEGTAVFTDPTSGNLLFYTDGISIFNGQDNQLLANGGGVNGQPSASEPALITPKQGSDGGSYYVFSVNYTDDSATTGDIYYSTLDLTQGAHGTVTNKNTHLFQGNVGEALDMVPHTNNADFWVIGYSGAGTINAFLVSSSGVSTSPVVSSTGLSGTVLRSAINHSYDYDHIVMAINNNSTGVIATANIDRATGKVSGVKTIVTGDLGFHASYSGDGTKLYYVRGTQGWSGVAYQYDLTSSTETMLGGTGLAAAKLAPDNKVYFVGYGKPYLAVVNSPNALGTASGFVANGLLLNGCLAAFGVPNQTAAYLSYLPPAPPTN